MNEYTIFQVDAFTTRLFGGNPAAVVPLADWLDEATLQNIAQENNLSETAFFTRSDQDDADFHLRWFTPGAEIDLCGHATLATAHVLFNELDWYEETLRFSTQEAGILTVSRGEGSRLSLDFPARPGAAIETSHELVDALGIQPLAVYKARDHMALFATEADVLKVTPDMDKLCRINPDGVIITAPSQDPEVDFVSRFFAPNHGVPEDPVTGSAHCTLVPFWADKLGKTTLEARQVSARGGELSCIHDGDQGRVYMSGQAVTYLKGAIFV
ncbi:PhzF family phenazine biosynthesis protein [Paremcibacter congregatus]|uniref:PhzF family phenazine biosynthesis protein n=1 Tax=Paremcibacter congregatus TaxID=2043170 RepID=UPI0030EB7A50|tara:strand:+ start:5675 stop:6484 length:810 start_codon:yes stop_codon:yes gene_type:complete